MLSRYFSSTASETPPSTHPSSKDLEVDFAKCGKPPNTKRLAVAISSFLLVIAGFPVWWRTTEINRPALPTDRIHQLRAQIASHPIRLPVEFSIIIGGEVPVDVSGLCQAIREAGLKKLGRTPGSILPVVRVIRVDASGCSCTQNDEVLHDCPCPNESLLSDLAVGDFLEPQIGGALYEEAERLSLGGHGKSTMFVLQGGENVKVRVGAKRSSWMAVPINMSPQSKREKIVQVAGMLLGDFFADGNGISAESEGDKLPVSAASEVLLSFSLCNSDPSEGYWQWDFDRFEREWLSEVIDRLSPVLGAETESQVLYHTKTDVLPRHSKSSNSFFLAEEDLPFFVNNEWQLDSGRTVANNKESKSKGSRSLGPHVLHWMIFIPPPSFRPLKILQSSTNAYSIPSWGGVMILNKNCTSSQEDYPKTPRAQPLSDNDLANVASIFVAQFRGLLGLHETSGADIQGNEDVAVQSAGSAGFSEWEIDVLIRRKVASDVAAAIHSLSALDRLIAELPNLEMPDFIGHQVEESLTAIEMTLAAAYSFNYVSCAKTAATARQLAEEAFSHPSILAQLNFPDQHKVAMYLPFFMPVGTALLAIVGAEVKRFFKRKRAAAKWKDSHVKVE
ncbi:hypothetical protein BSKO_01704 [Bryopsis sp. KO-2023]|nr:hypothetical protein BSKO_01704 [Bryopsis sp. KO-2023]